MVSAIRFFATRNDVVAVLEEVEAAANISYVRFGKVRGEEIDSYDHCKAIPQLGIARADAVEHGDCFLIVPPGVSVAPRRLARGEFVVDQLENPQTVAYQVGGIWGEDVLLHSDFTVLAKEGPALEIMRQLRSAVRRRFERIKAFYVGPEAARMLDSGKRLTGAIQEPLEYDLAR
jgi:hypothetical protein